MSELDGIKKNILQLEKNVEAVEKKLKEKLLSPEACQDLNERLEESSQELQDLEKKVKQDDLGIKKIKSLQDKIISLYGEIGNHLFDYEVSEIVKEASNLESFIQKGDMAKISQHVDDLKERLTLFHANYRPAGANFQLISEAESYVNKVKSLLAKSKGQSKEVALSALRKTMFRKKAA